MHTQNGKAGCPSSLFSEGCNGVMHSFQLAVGIATIGRPAILAETLSELRRQTISPARIVVCATKPADVKGIAESFPDVEILISTPGLTRQRNAILEALRDCDGVMFFDDDFLPAPSYLEAVRWLFCYDPDIVMVTGAVIADGIGGQGFSPAEGRRRLGRDALLDASATSALKAHWVQAFKPTYSGYGCNMAARLQPVFDNRVRFDERLPLYGWLEDVDFSRAMAAHGRIVLTQAARGVHLGVKSGRQSGLRLGYSQIANPLYLLRHGRYSTLKAARLIGQNLLMNMTRSFRPEDYIDRRGRLRGNVLALRDLFTGSLSPGAILDLK
ncbi:MAG: glycosyltransferase [Pseudomonadota bacterium]